MLECRSDHFNLAGWNPFDKMKTPLAEEPFVRIIVAASQQNQSEPRNLDQRLLLRGLASRRRCSASSRCWRASISEIVALSGARRT
jgi:hypothetical protein